MTTQLGGCAWPACEAARRDLRAELAAAERERGEARADAADLRERMPLAWVEVETHYQLLGAAEQDAARLADVVRDVTEYGLHDAMSSKTLESARAALKAHEERIK